MSLTPRFAGEEEAPKPTTGEEFLTHVEQQAPAAVAAAQPYPAYSDLPEPPGINQNGNGPEYTEADRPTFETPEVDDRSAPEKKADEKKQQFGKEFMASMFVTFLDMGTKRGCGMLAKTKDFEQYALSEEERETVTTAATHYFDSISFEASPGQILIGALLMTVGTRLGMAWYEGNQLAARKKVVAANLDNIEDAAYRAGEEIAGSPAKERTDFRVYASTGAYMVNNAGQFLPVDQAKDRPNFANKEEVKNLVRKHGLPKLKGWYQELREVVSID